MVDRGIRVEWGNMKLRDIGEIRKIEKIGYRKIGRQGESDDRRFRGENREFLVICIIETFVFT